MYLDCPSCGRLENVPYTGEPPMCPRCGQQVPLVDEPTLLALHRELTRHYGDDVAQETVCRLLACSPPPDDPTRWARKVGRRLAHEERRQRARLCDPPDDDVLTQPADQLARLEALDELSRVPPRLVEEAQRPGPLTGAAKTARHRLKRKERGK